MKLAFVVGLEASTIVVELLADVGIACYGKVISTVNAHQRGKSAKAFPV
jgi:hypothetical protein